MAKFPAILWRVILIGVIALLIYPISSGWIRLTVLAGILCLWIGALYAAKRRKKYLIGLGLMGILPFVFLLLPGRSADQKLLRSSYLKHLQRYEGTKYVWGGENIMGIDCSGLVRQAYINANLEVGLKTLNPEPVRKAISMNWRDCSAMALRDGYRGFTKPIRKLDSINRTDPASLKPGTIAVSENGIHVLAYLGDSKWIQADPGAGKVTINPVPNEQSWFQSPVVLLAWDGLDD